MIKYKIKKHKQLGCYILWKESYSKYGMGCRGIYHGTKEECKIKKKELIF